LDFELYYKSFFFFLRALRAEILRRKVRFGNFYFKKSLLSSLSFVQLQFSLREALASLGPVFRTRF